MSKKYGLNLKTSALTVLANFIGQHYGVHWKTDQRTSLFLEAISKIWKREGRGIFVDGDGIEDVIKQIQENEKRSRMRQLHETVDDTMDIDSSMINSIGFEDPDLSVMLHSEPDIIGNDHNDSFHLNGKTISHNINASVEWKEYFKIIDIKSYSNFTYNRKKKQYEYHNREKYRLLVPQVDDFLNHYINKYHILRDRLLRYDYYASSRYKSVADSHDKTEQPKTITMIKNLLGRNEQRFALFGMLTLNNMGIWQLQDESDKIELVLSQCIFSTDNYFVPGNFIVVDGFYSSTQKFHVLSATHPPAEPKHKTNEVISLIDPHWPYNKFGKVELTLKDLLKIELKTHPENKLIFLGGDLFLDNQLTIDLLKKVFSKIEEEMTIFETNNDILDENTKFNPVSIVFNGSFYSKTMDITDSSSTTHSTSTNFYKAGFDNLAFILESFPNICERCKLIFVPGDNDPWMSMVSKDSNSIWPKFQIPLMFTTKLRKIAKDIEFVSNPCRLNYLGHDILIARDNLHSRLCRNDITYLCKLTDTEIAEAMRNYPNSQISQLNFTQTGSTAEDALSIDKLMHRNEIESKKIVKTVLDQGDLSPFVEKVRPLSTNIWDVMNLTPVPDFICLSDTTAPSFTRNYKGCEFTNVGSFLSGGHAKYCEYIPQSKKSRIIDLY